MTVSMGRSTSAGKARTWRRPRLVVTGATAVALLVTACGDRTGSGGKQASATVSPLAGRLPQSVREKGVIEVGSDIAYPPMEFKDGSGKTVGIDPDIAAAMGRQLGVEFRFKNGTFDALLLGLRSKRYDIVMTAMADTKNRQNGISPKTGNKVGEGVDFVDYFLAGVSLYTRKGDDQGIRSWADLCGRKVAVQRGTVPEDLTRQESKKCTDGGKAAIAIESFDTDLEAQARLRSGGADASSTGSPVAAYTVKTAGGGNHFQLVGKQVAAAPYGIAVAKNNTQLRDALKAAVDAIIKNGAYGKIISKWDVPDGAVTEARINGGR
ncbi:ABC transporter substrate-binding protein [Streptomyces syringium]|uniref:ABC transporter substrate-binding protein n=1 Tax=Streptomyces syringium TaxID=76729 RepID=UPI00343867CE